METLTQWETRLIVLCEEDTPSALGLVRAKVLYTQIEDDKYTEQIIDFKTEGGEQ